MTRSISKKAGFVLLFASLIGAVVLAIGIAILDVTVKQITLSFAGRESQKAFYAADTGTECAFYLDRGGGNTNCPEGVFAEPANDSGDPARAMCLQNEGGEDFTYRCLGQPVQFESLSPEEYNEVGGLVAIDNQFSITGGSSGVCFNVLVTKRSNNTTTIYASGYNICDETSTRRFERAIRRNF